MGSTTTIIRGGETVEGALRTALAERDTRWEGEPYAWDDQLRMFRQQTRKNVDAVLAEVNGKLRRNGTGRDLGYPGGRLRPVRFDRAAAGLPEEEAG